MRLIAHRGNLLGPIPSRENSPDYIDEAINGGFECEIDLWEKDELFYLGHDRPQYLISLTDLIEWNSAIWIHAKNQESLEWLIEDKKQGGTFNFFWHENDKFSITSKNILWCYPSANVFKEGINVMPEWNNLEKEKLKNCVGICSDFIGKYR